MSAQDSFQTLKSFFESREAARQAMAAIKENVEIGIVIGGSVDCALFRRGDQPIVEQRPARDPDVVFHIAPESVEILNSKTKDQIGDVGVGVLKEILSGHIRVEVPGRLWNLMSRGYLDMIKKGGAPVTSLLARHGFSNVSKIFTTIKNLRS